MCGCGAVVKTTGAHHQVIGSIPTRKVFTTFLVVSHALPHATRSPILAREPPVPAPPSVTSYTQTRTHTHTHTYAHIHLRHILATYRPIHHTTTS